MQLLLCAATEREIAPTVHYLQSNPLTNLDISFLVTGIGLTSASYQLAKYICKRKPDFVLQAGIGGALDRTLPLNTAVMVQSERIGDEGVEENGSFQSLFDLKLKGANEFPWKNERLINEIPFSQYSDLPLVHGISINEITTNGKRIDFYRSEYGVLVESMEGAALHFACLMENIPFLQLRSISNYAGERDKKNWSIAAAVSTLNFEVERIMHKLSKE